MSWNKRMRGLHRWTSIVFTAAVLANFVAMGAGVEEVWVGFLALAPLLVLLITGLYLFVLPWLSRTRT